MINNKTIRSLFGLTALMTLAAVQLKTKSFADEFNNRHQRGLDHYKTQYKMDLHAGKILQGLVHIDSISYKDNTIHSSIGTIKCQLWDCWAANSNLMQGDSTMFMAVEKVGNCYEKKITPYERYKADIMNHHDVTFTPDSSMLRTTATPLLSKGLVIPFPLASGS